MGAGVMLARLLGHEVTGSDATYPLMSTFLLGVGWAALI